MPEIERDGYLVRTVNLPAGSAWEIVASQEAGLQQGLWRLLREVDFGSGEVRLHEQINIKEMPFFSERYFMLSTPLVWYRLLTTVEQRFAYQTWSRQERLDYVTLMNVLGF